MLWRRSWHAAPPKMDPREMTEWKNAIWAKPTKIISEPGKGKNIATEKMLLYQKVSHCKIVQIAHYLYGSMVLHLD